VSIAGDKAGFPSRWLLILNQLAIRFEDRWLL